MKSGYKITKPRMAVLEYLFRHHEMVAARDLYNKIKIIDCASVYRTLNLLESLQIVNVEIIGKEKMYCLSAKPHHHIVCKSCGRVEEVDCRHSFDHIKNFSKIHHQLTLTGVCNRCVRYE